MQELRASNPEILDVTLKCATSFGSRSQRILLELIIFYRLLRAEYKVMDPRLRLLAPFPRVTAATRDRLVEQIDDEGLERFTMSAIEELERDNAELLQMAHNFATRCGDYLAVMQGFALIYRALSMQAVTDAQSARMH
jgi:hypothetical protein